MFFNKIRSVYDLKNDRLVLSDFYDRNLFATLFMRRIPYPFEEYTDVDIYNSIYRTDVRVFIVDLLIGRYFIKRACDIFLVQENAFPVQYAILINPYRSYAEELVKVIDRGLVKFKETILMSEYVNKYFD